MLFATWLVADRFSGASAVAYVSRVSAVHSQAGITTRAPKGCKDQLTALLACIRRTFPSNRPPRRPFTPSQILEMAKDARSMGSVKGAAIADCLLVAFAGGCRASELLHSRVADTNQAKRRNVCFYPSYASAEYAVITLPRSKESQDEATPIVLGAVPSNPAACPVRALQRAMAAPAPESFPIFRKTYTRSLSGHDINVFVQRWCVAHSIDPAGANSHAVFRYSALTAMSVAGVPTARARLHLRWKPGSRAMVRYDRSRVSQLKHIVAAMYARGEGDAAAATVRTQPPLGVQL